MKNQVRLFGLALVAGLGFASLHTTAQSVTEVYVNKMVLKVEDDANVAYATKDYVKEINKNSTGFEIVGIRLLDNSNRYLIIGKHEVTADHQLNGSSVDFNMATTHGKDEMKFHSQRYPKVNFAYVAIDERDAKDLLENVKQLRSNYVESDTLKIKEELHIMQYRLNKDFAVSMSRGKGGSSAKYFDLWIGNRKQEISSDKFILYLTQFLGNEE